jgi:hypothetical protein
MWPNAIQEVYPDAWEGAITLDGERFTVKVGVGLRSINLAKGQTPEDRGRMVVFLAGYPVCEFVKAIDGDT